MLLSTMRANLIAVAAALAAPPSLASPQDAGSSVLLKPGEEVVVPVAISERSLALGKPRLAKPGAEPGPGEIAVAVVKHGLSPYADLIATEKTGMPVDFVATGLIGDIKIDEIRVCGRIDAPIQGRIASGSWRVSLNRFAVHSQGEECR